MNTMLPAPREVPPLRQAQIRAELARASTERSRPYRRWVAPVAVAAGLSVLAAAVWVVPRQFAAHQGTGSPPTAGRNGPPAFPGLPDGERQAIERGCGQSLVDVESGSPKGDSTSTAGSARLYNLVSDPAGRMALLYGKAAAFYCVVGGPGKPYNASESGMAVNGPPDGPVTIDLYLITQVGDSGSHQRDRPDMLVLGGRVSDRVARVTLASGPVTVTANVANGTFFGRILDPAPWTDEGGGGPVVRAYDAGGALLATVGG